MYVSESGPGGDGFLWTVLKYGILVYFNILILPFHIVSVVLRVVKWLAESMQTPVYPLPMKTSYSTPSLVLDSDTDGACTPRSSEEWETTEWEERMPLAYKRRNLCGAEPCGFWEDDDGYNVRLPRNPSVIFQSITEED